MRSHLRKLAVAVGIVTLACSSGEITSSLSQGSDANAPSSVAITTSAPDLIVGTKVPLVIAVKNLSGQDIANAPVAWSSSDTTVATVTSAGVVNAVRVGTVVITGAVGGISASVTITIKPVPVATVTVSLANALLVGDVATAVAVPFDAAGNALTGRTITWSTSTPTIASVGSDGVVTGLAAGTATISATIDGVTNTATVVVSAKVIAVASIAISVPESLVVTLGRNVQANAVVRDASGNILTGKAIAWSSSNTTAATVSGIGVVTALANGTTVITATSGGKSASLTLVVAISVASTANSLTITSVASQIAETQTTQTTVVVKDPFNNVLNPAVTFTTSDPLIATVSRAGTVTGVGQGFATITATGAGATGTLTINVFPTSVAVVQITAPVTSLPVGSTSQFTATVRDPQGNVLNHPIAWASSTPGIASVSSTGVVTGVAIGTAIIVASDAGVTAQVTVTVATAAVATVYLTSPVSSIQPGQTAQTNVVLRDITGMILNGRPVTYASSDPAIATVSATGVVTGVAAGTVQITASSGGKSGTVSLSIPPVATVSVTAPLTSPQIGQTTQAAAVLRDAQGNPATNRVVTWASSNTAAVTVSNTGFITAVGSGSAIITATSEGAVGSLPVLVSSVETVMITASSTALQPGQTTQTTVTLRDLTGNILNGRVIAYTSSNPAVATVSATGLVTGLAGGVVQISAISEGKTGSMTLSVPPVAQVIVAAPLTTLQPLQSTQATVTLRDAQSNAVSNRVIAWSSSNPAALTVSSTGLVTAVGPGTSQITVTSEGVIGTLAVTVPPVATVLVTGTQLFPTPGTTTQLAATLLDAASNAALNRAVVWSSSAPQFATVSNTGLVSAVAVGTTTISVTSEGKTGSVSLQVVPVNVPVVVPPVATVAVTAALPTIQPTQTTQTIVVTRDAANNVLTGRQITYSSSNPAIAAVDGAGLVTAFTTGTVTITALSEGQTGTVSINIPPVAVVTVTTPVSTLQVGQSTQGTFTLRDAQGNAAINRTIVWSSSNPAAMSVTSGGLVTAVGSGSSQISVTSEGITGSTTVATPAVATVFISAPQTTLQPAQTTQTSVVVRDISGNILGGNTITYTSSAPAVATVSAAGLVTGVAGGSAQITATVAGKSGSVTVSIPQVSTVTVTASATKLQPTQTTPASVTLRDAQNNVLSNRVSVWSSSNVAVLTVSNTGVVTAVGPGSAQVIVTSEGATGGVFISVPPVASITLSAPTQLLNVAQPTQVTVSLLDAGSNPALNRAIVWTSSSPAVATVSSTGLVSGVGVGTTSISATSEGKTASLSFTVDQVVGSVTVSSPASALLVGQTAQLSVTARDPSGVLITSIPPVWSTSNPARATITASGLITQVAGGTFANVTFTATVRGVSSTVAVSMVGHRPETVAELPRVFVNTALPAAPAAGGRIIGVSTTTQLVNALNSSAPGDVIELANGATFVGNFILPNKNTTSTNWIVLRPASQVGMPAPGARMTPTIAAAVNLPKVVSPNNQGAFTAAFGAHHFRFIGLEITNTRNVTNTGLLRFGGDQTDGQTTLALTPHDLIADRLWVHGDAVTIVRRCIALNSGSAAVIDSYISDCHDTGQDAQAIAGWNGPGPFKVVNNYLEGSGENVMFGGADAAASNMVPSDIEFRGNHVTKPLAWKHVWQVKNLLELKDAQRILIEGNIFENVWQDAQDGTAIKFKSTNQQLNAPWSGSQDVTFRFNLVRNIGAGLALATQPDNTAPTNRMHLITVTDNLFMNINTGLFDGAGRGILITQDMQDVTVAHNTIMEPSTGAMIFSPPDPGTRLSIRDNVTLGIVKGDALGAGVATLTATNAIAGFFGNVIVLPSPAGMPGFNYYPTTSNAVGFVSLAGGDLRLSGSSTFFQKATDGTNPGADVQTILNMTSAVIVP
ncbi:MAG: Ig-like domain-containing protein [Gemmatimonadaceae bacterium]